MDNIKIFIISFFDMMLAKIDKRPHKLKKYFCVLAVWALSFTVFIKTAVNMSKAFAIAYEFNTDLLNGIKYTSIEQTQELWVKAWYLFFAMLLSAVILMVFSVVMGKLFKNFIVKNKEKNLF